MATVSILDILRTAPKTDIEAEYDSMMVPHWSWYLSPMDVENLRYIATSKKFSGNMNKKYKMINDIMTARGFVRFNGGTNRVVYKYLEDQRILAKIAVDRVGMNDNPAEFMNQHLIKPYCAKMFHVTPCGTVGIVERVLPITSVQEFKLVADCVFDLLYYKIIGKYIIEDIGTKYFMNYGIRKGFGVVLLDYPYIFELDGEKIFCKNILPDGSICMGEIDYDKGFNNLVCLKCGRKYNASDLRKDVRSNNFIINKGGLIAMNVKIVKNGEVIVHSNSSDVIRRPAPRRKINPDTDITARIIKNGKVLAEVVDGNIIDPSVHENESINPAENEIVTETTEFDIADDINEKTTEEFEDVNDESTDLISEEAEDNNDVLEESNSGTAEDSEEESENVNKETDDEIGQTPYGPDDEESTEYPDRIYPDIPEDTPVKRSAIYRVKNDPFEDTDTPTPRIVQGQTSDSSGRKVIGGNRIGLSSPFINEKGESREIDVGDY